nr:MAG TPA: hypothetical protein [Caudoviricetes sp.]
MSNICISFRISENKVNNGIWRAESFSITF